MTASKFGDALTKSVKGQPFVVQVPRPSFYSVACQWGIDHEKDSIAAYEEHQGVTVSRCGFMVSPDGKLGGSPDGVVKETGTLVEIKCPYSMRDVEDMDKFIAATNYWYFTLSGSKWKFNMNIAQGRAYFHQVQGLMYLMDLERCHFVVWNPVWLKLSQ